MSVHATSHAAAGDSPAVLGRPLLSAQRVSVRSGERALLDNISLDLREGEIVTVIGPNGAGKTTLLKTLLGFIAPSSGSITRSSALRIGYMPQKLSLNPLLPMTVQRFLQQTGATAEAIQQALAETGVATLAQQSLHKASGGELQRILLARALLRKPELLVLDEPAQGVDVCGQADLYRLIADVRQRYRCGVLLVSHDLHLVMAATDRMRPRSAIKSGRWVMGRMVRCQGNPALFSGGVTSGLTAERAETCLQQLKAQRVFRGSNGF